MKFMKKTVFCVALVAALFLAVPANAQFKFGPKVGMNISTLSLSGNLSDNFKANNISSFTGGLMAEFMVPVIGIGVDASLMYTRKGSELKDITSGISENKPTIEEEIVKMLRTVYDPEIPVNIYDLGLIYNIEENDGTVKIEMTLTAPNCPAADFIIEDVRMKVESIENVKNVDIQLVFEPEWDKDMMSEEAKLELGLL